MSCCCHERCHMVHHHGYADSCGHGRPKMSAEHLARFLAYVKAEIEDLEKRIKSLEKEV